MKFSASVTNYAYEDGGRNVNLTSSDYTHHIASRRLFDYCQ